MVTYSFADKQKSHDRSDIFENRRTAGRCDLFDRERHEKRVA